MNVLQIASILKARVLPPPTNLGSVLRGTPGAYYYALTWSSGSTSLRTYVWELNPETGQYDILRDDLAPGVAESTWGMWKDGSTSWNLMVQHYRGSRTSEGPTITVGP